MIKPGAYMVTSDDKGNKKVAMVIAVVPDDKYVLVLEAGPARLRQLTPVEFMLLWESARTEEVPVLGEKFARAGG